MVRLVPANLHRLVSPSIAQCLGQSCPRPCARRIHQAPSSSGGRAVQMTISNQPQRLASVDDYRTFVDKFDTFLFDCDGVLWHGDHLIPGAVDVLAYLREHSQCTKRVTLHETTDSCAAEKRIIFVTNNATKSRAKYKGKFDKLGVQADVVSHIDAGPRVWTLIRSGSGRDLRIGVRVGCLHL